MAAVLGKYFGKGAKNLQKTGTILPLLCRRKVEDTSSGKEAKWGGNRLSQFGIHPRILLSP